ncbi:MAG: sigma-70 family RNA polymerase sigma factor [Chitinophagaceae bacterium]|nr:sigma-70 family RNA polymerase sigma factor [Chitinophagaceae bacterium]
MNTTSNHNISESDLIKGCVEGNRKMQEELYLRFASKMYAVCFRYANNADDAQDLLQEGFIKVYKNLHRFRAEGSFEGWIRRVFVNTSIEHYRKKSLALSTVSEKEENSIEDVDITALDKLAQKDLLLIIQELSPGYKTVFNLYVIEGYSHKEIGELLGISEGTSKSQLARAKALLQKKITQYLSDTRKSYTR